MSTDTNYGCWIPKDMKPSQQKIMKFRIETLGATPSASTGNLHIFRLSDVSKMNGKSRIKIMARKNFVEARYEEIPRKCRQGGKLAVYKEYNDVPNSIGIEKLIKLELDEKLKVDKKMYEREKCVCGRTHTEWYNVDDDELEVVGFIIRKWTVFARLYEK